MSLKKISHLKLIKVSGDDAASFLQGQLSNDIQALDSGWQFSAYCTPKGRAFATFIVWQSKDLFFLLCDNDITESVLKRLRMYVMRSKVVFEVLATNPISVFKQTDLDALSPKLMITSERYSMASSNGLSVLFFGSRALVIDHKEALDNIELDHAESNDWAKADIKDALPIVTAQTSEMFIPQMLNMDILNGISFKKGCYTGQEIIARMRYLGKIKQRSFVCALDASSIEENLTVTAGDKIINQDGKLAGNIVNTVKLDNDNVNYVLASLKLDYNEANTENVDQETSFLLKKDLMLESGVKVIVENPQPYKV